jgi:hypothetical protein
MRAGELAVDEVSRHTTSVMDANYVYIAAPASVISAVIGALVYRGYSRAKERRPTKPSG